MQMFVLSCGLFFSSGVSLFCQPGLCTTLHNELCCNQAAFDILLFCSFHCLCLIYSFSCSLLFWSFSTAGRERESCLCYKHQFSCPKWQVKRKIHFPQTKAECSERCLQNNGAIWATIQIKLYVSWWEVSEVRSQAFICGKDIMKDNFKCIKSFRISWVEPNKKCAYLQLLESRLCGWLWWY